MLFQTLDDKQECIKIYTKKKFSQNISDKLTKTWSYSAFLKNENVEYAQLYCGGKSLSEACPEFLQEEWGNVYQKLKAFYRSMQEAKLNLEDHCFYELVPQRFLIDYCEIKNKITEYIFDTYNKPRKL